MSGAIKHPRNRTLAEFHDYWGTRHGPLFAHTPSLRQYVQHHTLEAAVDAEPRPTLDGASFFWYDDLEALRQPAPSPKLSDAITEAEPELFDWYVRSRRYGDPDVMTLSETVRADDRQLFDREPGWPLHHKRTSIVAVEHVVVDGSTTPSMVKLVVGASRLPGLTLEEFREHWAEVHGPLGANLPGLRRYVQNVVQPEAYAVRWITHDGFAELWFDDLDALQRAYASAEWRALRLDGVTLFAQPLATTVARERIIKALQ